MAEHAAFDIVLWQPETTPVFSKDDRFSLFGLIHSELTDRLRQWQHLLSDQEQTKAKSYKFQDTRARFTNTRIALRLLLAHWLAKPAEAIEIVANPYGKPLLKGHPHMQFNCSHSQDRSLIALRHGEPIGVDLECMSSSADIPGLAERILSAEEMLEQGSVDAINQQMLCRFWCCKEAAVKAASTGFVVDPRKILVKWNKANSATVSVEQLSQNFAIHWDMWEDYCLAVATQV